jgi:hypothetical protein
MCRFSALNPVAPIATSPPGATTLGFTAQVTTRAGGEVCAKKARVKARSMGSSEN